MFKTWKNISKVLSPTKKIQKEAIKFNKEKADLDKEKDKLVKQESLKEQLDKVQKEQFEEELKRAKGNYANVTSCTLKENKTRQSIEYSVEDNEFDYCKVTRKDNKDTLQNTIYNTETLVENQVALSKGIVAINKVHNLLNNISLSKLLSLSPSGLMKDFDNFMGNAMQSLGEYSGLTVSIFKLVKSILPELNTFVTTMIPKIIDSIKTFVSDPKNGLTIRTIIRNFNQGLISKEFYEKKIKSWAKYIPGLLKMFNYLLGYEGEVQEVNLTEQFSTVIQNSNGQILNKNDIIDKVNLTTKQIQNFPQKIKSNAELSIKETMEKSSIMDLLKNHKNYNKVKISNNKSNSSTYYGNFSVPLSAKLNTKLSKLSNSFNDVKSLNDFDEIHINGKVLNGDSTLEDLLSSCYSLSDIAQVKDYISKSLIDGLTELLQDYPDIYGISIQPTQIVEGLKNNFDNLQNYTENIMKSNNNEIPKDILKEIAIDDFRNKIKGVMETYPKIDMDISDLIIDRDLSVNKAIINVKGKDFASPLYSSGVVYTIKHPYMEYLYQNDKVLYEDILKGLYNYSLKIGRPIDIDGQFIDFYNYLDTLPRNKLKMYMVDSKGEHSNSDNIKSYFKENKVTEYTPQNEKINVQFVIKNENGKTVYQQVPNTKSVYETRIN